MARGLRDECATVADGWYLDAPTAPTTTILCRATCDDANASTDVRREARVGCKAPPPR